ncbi:MAG: sugar ABC transporter [Desulfamplus sp.]|nr:sugar ABC transporter [Desulfamplus sp.]
MKKIIMAILMLSIFSPVIANAQKETILVIQSYHDQYPWDASYKKGLEEILAQDFKLSYFEMDTKRIPKSEFQKKADAAWDMYKKIKPVLVILGDDNALEYLGPRFVDTTTPVVYLGINNNPRYYDMVGHKNITGILERPLIKRSIKYIDDLIGVKKALVLFDSGTTSKVVGAEVFSGKDSLTVAGIAVDIKFIDTLDVWKETVLASKEKGYDAIITGLYHTIRDSDGNHVDAEDVLQWTSRNTPLPPFALWDFSVGQDKAIGGYVLFGKEQGIEAGRMAKNILSDRNSLNLPFPKTAHKGRLLFSKTQLESWGLKIPDNMNEPIEYIK